MPARDNQSLRGLALRWGVPTPVLWAAPRAVAAVGLLRARAAHRSGSLVAAATLVGLTSVLISPIAWVHHAVWVVPAIGVIVSDGRSGRRIAAAVAVTAVAILTPVSAVVAAKSRRAHPTRGRRHWLERVSSCCGCTAHHVANRARRPRQWQGRRSTIRQAAPRSAATGEDGAMRNCPATTARRCAAVRRGAGVRAAAVPRASGSAGRGAPAPTGRPSRRCASCARSGR